MWRRLPVWLRAIANGLAASGVPTVIWAVMAGVNFRLTPAFPWSVIAMAGVLWIYWRFVRGSEFSRANTLSPRMSEVALIAGGSGVVAVWAAFRALRGLLHIAPKVTDVARFPIASVLAAIVMGSAVAGICEEVGFRGFMQLPMERAYGPVVAIGVTSIIFTLAHLTHGAGVLPFLPFYFVVSVIYGTIAFLTGSIYPSMMLHVAGDALMLSLQFLGARFGTPPPVTGRIAILPLILAIAFASVSAIAFRTTRRHAFSA